MDFNWREIRNLLIVILVLVLVLDLVLLTGCVSAAKNQYKKMTATPIPTPPPTPIPTPTPSPFPTVTEDPDLWLYRTGGHYLGEWSNITRKRAAGLQDLQLHTTIYGYKFEPNYYWWSWVWGEYLIEKPGPGKKFLFVFMNQYTDGDDVRPWGVHSEQVRVSIGNQYYNESGIYDKTVRIQELERTWTLDRAEIIGPYGYQVVNNKGKISLEDLGYIKGGWSNAWDGYICYEVPSWTRVQDVKVWVSFGGLSGDQWWSLLRRGETQSGRQ